MELTVPKLQTSMNDCTRSPSATCNESKEQRRKMNERKTVIIPCTVAFSVFTLLTISADSLTTLLYWRLFTELGLGGAMPAHALK